MLSGWITHSKMTCLYCMDDTKAFQLHHGRKTSWFDYHRRFLPQNSKLKADKKGFMRAKVVINDEPSLIRCGEEILMEIESLLLMKVTKIGADAKNAEIAKGSGWRKRSILWDLLY
ncbi:hypothetical protein Scep_019847 [Stephania cephalantha]|uniref:Uncharacterized protein n=1 Tax=Stephania cephalantha TaxID=152367 RepID=A0AAP0NMJ8_9MAGN